MKRHLIIFTVTFLCLCSATVAQTPVYLQKDAPLEERVEDALYRMNLEEKIALIHAQAKFCSPGVPRLGIPENWMTDGPHGIRAEVLWDEWDEAGWTSDSCIAFPALTALAATWNIEMSALYGKCIGEEARYRNKNVLLGPGVNMNRTPLCGRNFEYMGEDPLLASKMVVPYVREVQKNGVAACVKHFALNNQEKQRWDINPVVDDRALYEIYLPAFKAAVVEGGAWAMMGAYNKFEGIHCCHNHRLVNEILKGEWGFDGVYISDWGGTHDTMEAIQNGLDMEFGTWTDGLGAGASDAYDNYFLAQPYLKLIKEGKIGTRELDDKVRRILRLVFRTNMSAERPYGSFGTAVHSMAARKIACESIVLLKNDREMLPINRKNVSHILVVGDNATRSMTVGGGSSSLKAKYEVSVLDAVKEQAGPSVKVTYARGYDVVCDGADPYSYENVSLKAEAVSAAREADIVLFVGGLNKENNQDCEGDDRKSYSLPYGQDSLIDAILKVNRKLAVVIVSGNAVAMPWLDKVPALVQSWYGGSEGGNALADVLFGKVNPSGKLPYTIYSNLSDCAAHAFGVDEYPGNGTDVKYSEGIFTGYRWTDKMCITPLFPFGYGLSYTDFEYSSIKTDSPYVGEDGKITFKVRVKNTGKVPGKEIVQLYISDKDSSVQRPYKELKDFAKVSLEPGETSDVILTVDVDGLAWFDAANHRWVAEAGEFEALVGSSSSDIKSKVSFTLERDHVFNIIQTINN